MHRESRFCTHIDILTHTSARRFKRQRHTHSNTVYRSLLVVHPCASAASVVRGADMFRPLSGATIGLKHPCASEVSVVRGDMFRKLSSAIGLK
jgi:hypothetical protein